METQDCIVSRRSIRKYKTQEISKEIVSKLLEAAMYAPSARNTQSWQFIVISDKEKLAAITKVHPYAKMLLEAPLAILVCGDKLKEENESYLAINCSAATQNILLSAHSLEIGSVWLGVYPRIERITPLIDLFELPEHILPISLIALGYADEQKEIPVRFNLENIHYEKF
ncbi:MAG: nitroreductase family protein [Bacteroidetes bacterium]|nr:nitroreductase family protein [Bacteroidota bacterium]